MSCYFLLKQMNAHKNKKTRAVCVEKIPKICLARTRHRCSKVATLQTSTFSDASIIRSRWLATIFIIEIMLENVRKNDGADCVGNDSEREKSSLTSKTTSQQNDK